MNIKELQLAVKMNLSPEEFNKLTKNTLAQERYKREQDYIAKALAGNKTCKLTCAEIRSLYG